MDLPKISIVVPVFNVEPYIAECLQSVMRQNYGGAIECIVVDDCGIDSSMAVVERLIAGYDGPIDFIVLHHEKNKGVSCARNTGMDVAHGDYIFFLDCDDWISDDCIGHLVSLANNGNYEMVAGGHADFYGENDVRNSKRDVFSKDDGLVVQEVSGREFLYGWLIFRSVPIAVWNKLYPIGYLKKTKVHFDKEVFLQEDVLFNFELFNRPSTICRSNRVTYYYRQRKGSKLSKVRHQSDSLSWQGQSVTLWMALRRVKVDGFDDLYESYLHYYGLRVFRGSKKLRLPFYHIFKLLHKEYPYFPLRLWVHKEKDFHWYKSRMIWSCPSFLGFGWFQVKWWKNNRIDSKK